MKSQWSNDPDRISYFDGENTKAGLPSIDEMVIHDANVHLECLDDSCFMLIVENDIHSWRFNLFSRKGNGRAIIEAHLYEDNSVGQLPNSKLG